MLLIAFSLFQSIETSFRKLTIYEQLLNFTQVINVCQCLFSSFNSRTPVGLSISTKLGTHITYNSKKEYCGSRYP